MVTYDEIEGMNGFMENLKCFDVLGLPKINMGNLSAYGIRDVRLAFYNGFIITGRQIKNGDASVFQRLIDLVDAYVALSQPYELYKYGCEMEKVSRIPINEIADPYCGYKKFYENDLQGRDLADFFIFLKKIKDEVNELNASVSENAKYAKVGESIVPAEKLRNLAVDLTDACNKTIKNQATIEEIISKENEENKVAELVIPQVDFFARRLELTKKKNN